MIHRAVLARAAVMLVALGSGCDSIDPTEQAFAIRFWNDLGQPVALKLCSDDNCHNFDYGDTVKPNGSYPANISDRELLTRWLVADQKGHVLGCLPLSFNGKYDHVVVRMSQKVPCPGRQPLRVSRGRKVSDRV
jgi:hypothetical protein